MRKCYCILFMVFIFGQLVGCGQSGKLYLPETPQQQHKMDTAHPGEVHSPHS